MSLKRRSAALAAAAALALILAGCAGGGTGGAKSSSGPSADEIEKALSTPTTIDFWSWVPDIQNEIDAFQKEHPAITVKLQNQGGATAQYQKLRAAIKSGDVPDVAQIEYSFLPSFTITKSILDLGAYGYGDYKKDYSPSAWAQVSSGDSVWGLPQDLGPTGLLYRTDLLEKAGVQPPTTWEEFAAAAKTVKEKTGSYITDLPGNSFSPLLALLWQAGAKPFGYDGDKTVTIDFDSAEVKKVVGYWNDLIKQDLIATEPQLDDNWYQRMSRGDYATWLAAAWGPVFLQGTAANTSGLWRAAPLPQWDAASPASGNQGGSADVVLADSKHPIVAAEFVKFLNHDEASTTKLATEQFLFPSLVATQKESAFRDQKSDFYGGQAVNDVFVDIAGTVPSDWQWLPFNDYASSSFKETLGAAITERSDLFTALDEWKSQLVDYAKQQGFTVK
ncbi:ABC transporter substrate-binding protein [Leifsonia naganoensis]|uniref:Multiple sugar transport system substrate-binding protein n=1 Tax=Leifsonia naganoensis TaxID=150025 RepID=A0A853DJC1_9MICO|nr:extracellular solute-binding protein [Leifsonia naganoensis]NYK09176.1 multiple sugar transport system substrate-binding protein [Leifsonia naganoensis]